MPNYGKKKMNSLTPEMIKQMNARPCQIGNCEKPLFAHVSVPMVAISESGKLEFPYNNKDQSAGVSIPMCGYHMAMFGSCETFLFGVDMNSNDLILRAPEWIKQFESNPTDLLEDAIEKYKGQKEYQESIKIMKAIIEARKFEEGSTNART